MNDIRRPHSWVKTKVKLKLIKDSKLGLCVVQEDTNCLLENVKSVSLDVYADEEATMTLTIYMPKEDATVKNEDID